VNSGKKQATTFSNVINSRKTSLGTFLTDTTYYGSNGYSLRLDGLTAGMNDKARERYIVIHGADYANESFIKKNGYLGRSWGCPALPKNLSREIIDTIKGGSVIYASA
ncbi:peptidase, partial [Vibrio xuii]